MRAMVIAAIGTIEPDSQPLKPMDLSVPEPGVGEIRIRVSVCGVCHTELDEIEGRTPPERLPVAPGHEVIGYVDKRGANASRYSLGERVGVGWIHHSNGLSDENLSDEFRATGRDVQGGYAEYMTVPQDYAYAIPRSFSDAQAAPLLCAGGVGYRAVRLTRLRNGQALGLTGFGSSGHLVLQLVRHCFPDSPVYVFARDSQQRDFARELGACWAGPTEASPEQQLDAIIDTTPAWCPVVQAMANLKPGGRLVINAIRKESNDREVLASIDYQRHLWMEKEIKTVANVTRQDITEFLPLAAAAGIQPSTQLYPLAQANQALLDLKFSSIRGAKVLTVAVT